MNLPWCCVVFVFTIGISGRRLRSLLAIASAVQKRSIFAHFIKFLILVKSNWVKLFTHFYVAEFLPKPITNSVFLPPHQFKHGSVFAPKNAEFQQTTEKIYFFNVTVSSKDGDLSLWKCHSSAPRVRTEPSKPSNVLEFDFSVQVPSIVLESNSMFSNVLETKCLENAATLVTYWR